MKYIYIAGPYSGIHHDYRSFFEIDRNIMRAMEAADALCNAGVGFFCPHSHSAHFETIAPEVPSEYWKALDMHFMDDCDGILMLPNWESSSGSKREKDIMEQNEKPVFYDVQDAIEWAQLMNRLEIEERQKYFK